MHVCTCTGCMLDRLLESSRTRMSDARCACATCWPTPLSALMCVRRAARRPASCPASEGLRAAAAASAQLSASSSDAAMHRESSEADEGRCIPRGGRAGGDATAEPPGEPRVGDCVGDHCLPGSTRSSSSISTNPGPCVASFACSCSSLSLMEKLMPASRHTRRRLRIDALAARGGVRLGKAAAGAALGAAALSTRSNGSGDGLMMTSYTDELRGGT